MQDKPSHHWRVSNRREFFTQAGSGLAAMALASVNGADNTERSGAT